MPEVTAARVEFRVVRVESPDGVNEDGSPRQGVKYTFLVNGTPSMVWAPECQDPNEDKTFFIDRIISRLKLGRSEVFGPPGVLVDGKPAHAGKDLPRPPRGSVSQEGGPPEMEIKDGKPREKRKGWKYTLDGKESEESYPSEQAARAACAVAGFMSRGKLGRLREAQEALEVQFAGKSCKVYACAEEHAIVATVDGVKYSVGLAKGEAPVFKRRGENAAPPAPPAPKSTPPPEPPKPTPPPKPPAQPQPPPPEPPKPAPTPRRK